MLLIAVREKENLLMDLYGNMKLTDLDDYEKKSAILDKDNNVICPYCKKLLAKVTKYGMIRPCKKCEKAPRYTFMMAHDDCCGRRLG
jgi:uncharacterized CHY-type Zn-finger protein